MKAMNTARVHAYAKLNLTLDVLGAENGYHNLDSLVVTVDLYDAVIATARKDALVNVRMHGMGSENIPPEENNAVRAGEAFVSRFHTMGADISIRKNIPVGAGLGGSSADAAGVLLALSKLYGKGDAASLKELADGLGSDTGYLLTGGLARIRGRGDVVERLPYDLPLSFLLLVPRAEVSTAECYAAFDRLGGAGAPRTERACACLAGGNAEWAVKLFGNDLYQAACTLEPAVAETLAAARSFSPAAAGMTGSGSACYACFPERELCEWAKSRYRGKCRAYVVSAVDPSKKKGIRSPFVLDEAEKE